MGDSGGARVFYANDSGYGSSALFGSIGEDTRVALANTVTNYVDQTLAFIPDFTQNVLDRYNKIRNSQVVQHITNLKDRITSIWQPESIRFLSSITQIQQAPKVMQPYVMAYPPLRELYQQGSLSGYDKTYVDAYPNCVGNTHYPYRRVMDGIVHSTEEFTGHVQYHEFVPEEDLMSLIHKTSVLATWDIVENHLNSNSNADLTSVWNGTY